MSGGKKVKSKSRSKGVSSSKMKRGISKKKVEKKSQVEKKSKVEKLTGSARDKFEKIMRAADLSVFKKKESTALFGSGMDYSFGRPVCNFWDDITDSIVNNRLTIIAADTGAGKTTQVPKMAWQAVKMLHDKDKTFPMRVVCTQPRVLAVKETGMYVSQEMGLVYGENEVGYHYRGERKVNQEDPDKLSMIFMTDGIMVKSLSNDPSGKEYGVIIVDEVHERSTNIDLILLLLKQLLKSKSKTRVVIMSATIDLNKFANYFKGISLRKFSVPGKMYPVEVEYSETDLPKSQKDVRYAAICKALNIVGTTTSPADIVVFLSSKADVQEASRVFNIEVKSIMDGEKPETCNLDKGVLENVVKLNPVAFYLHGESSAMYVPDHVNNVDYAGIKDLAINSKLYRFGGRLVKGKYAYPVGSEDKGDGKYSVDWSDGVKSRSMEEKHKMKVVFATNVAEAALTVNNVGYVIDSGKQYKSMYDPVTYASKLPWVNISQAAAIQRAGRAGRTRAGICYRLYSKREFDTFTKFPTPPILDSNLVVPIEDLLNLVYTSSKAISMVMDLLTRFIDPPPRLYIKAAMHELGMLGVIRDGRVSELGALMLKLPLSPANQRTVIYADLMGISKDIIPVIALAETVSSMVDLISVPVKMYKDVEVDKLDFLKNAKCNDFKIFQNIMKTIKKLSKEKLRDWCRNNFIKTKVLKDAMMIEDKITVSLRNLKDTDEYEILKSDLSLNLKDIKNKFGSAIAAGSYWNVAYKLKDGGKYKLFGKDDIIELGQDLGCPVSWNNMISNDYSDYPKYVCFRSLSEWSGKLYANEYTEIDLKDLYKLEPNYWHNNSFCGEDLKELV